MGELSLSAADFKELFGEVDAHLADSDPDGEIVRAAICGGAAVAMMKEGRTSKDVDIISDGIPPEVREAVRVVGDRRGLPSDWMNDSAKIWAPKHAGYMERIFSGQRLHLYIPEVECLLALKLESMRPEDREDILFLLDSAGVSTAERALEILEEYIPSQRLTAQVQFKVIEFFESL